MTTYEPTTTAPPQDRDRGLAARVGAALLSAAREVGASIALLGAVVRRPQRTERRALLRQTHVLANRSLPFVVITMAFSGAILVVQAATQARQMIGDLSSIGPIFLQLLVREFGPTVVALMVAARYGAGAAAELATMTVTEQVDALRMAGADPVGMLVAPRVGAGLLGMVPLAVVGTATAFWSGAVVGHVRFGIGWDTYFSHRVVTHGDVVTGTAKALAFGIAVPLYACRAGLRARGGAPGVGRATTQSVIGASLAVLVLDLCLGALGYALFEQG